MTSPMSDSHIPALMPGKLYVVEPEAEIMVIPKRAPGGAWLTLPTGCVFMYVGRRDGANEFGDWCHEVLFQGTVCYANRNLARDVEFLER